MRFSVFLSVLAVGKDDEEAAVFLSFEYLFLLRAKVSLQTLLCLLSLRLRPTWANWSSVLPPPQRTGPSPPRLPRSAS